MFRSMNIILIAIGCSIFIAQLNTFLSDERLEEKLLDVVELKQKASCCIEKDQNALFRLSNHALDWPVIRIFKLAYYALTGPPYGRLYERTCGGKLHQTATEQRLLRCMYTTNGRPYRLISPFKMEQLNLEPPIVFYHEVFTNKNAKRIIEVATPSLKTSEIVAFVSTMTTLPYQNYPFLHTLLAAVRDVTGLSLSTIEWFQVIKYDIGEYCKPHYDSPNEKVREEEKLIATALLYLVDVELGGETVFPYLKLSVKPTNGGLLFWYNLHESSENDNRTMHYSCPILKGTKWIISIHFSLVDKNL